ncbi:MAG: hypothetical protein JEZ07_01855 [Phycisphaerae bacterium]|nr:hypothetical protein [Phycisphaerae bacterium]
MAQRTVGTQRFYYRKREEQLLFDREIEWFSRENLQKKGKIDPKLPFAARKITVQGQDLYVKTYLVSRFMGCPAEKAFKNLLVANKRGVPVPEPIAWAKGKIDGYNTCILITKSVGKITSLSELIWQNEVLTERKTEDILNAAGRLLGLLHVAGIVHNNLSFGKIFVSEPIQRSSESYLLDLQRVSISNKKDSKFAAIYDDKLLANMAVIAGGLENWLDPKYLRILVKSYLEVIEPFKMWTENEVDQYLKELKPLIAHRNTQLSFDKIQKQDFRNILIIKPSSLGDVVRTVPILSGLRKKYPKAKISWLVRPEFKAIIDDNPDLDEIIVFDRKFYGKIGRSWQATVKFVKFLAQLKQKQFDLVLDIQGLFRSGFMAKRTGARVRVGFSHARELAHIFYTHKIVAPKDQHAVLDYWRFAEILGFGESEMEFKLPISDELKKTCESKLKENGLEDSDYVVLLPGGTVQAKRWSTEKFAKLAEQIVKCYDNMNIGIVMLGVGATEKALAKEICHKSQCKIVDMIDKTSLKEMTGILHGAIIAIGNDSGPLHISAAMSVATIGIYGPTNPEVVGPWGQMDNVVMAGAKGPRKKRYSKAAEHNIENVSVDDVMEKLKGIRQKAQGTSL